MATFYKAPEAGKVLVRDLNRYRKIYRYIRKKPKLLQCDSAEGELSHFHWVSAFVVFENQTSVTETFIACFEEPPAVVATAHETSPGTSGNLNVFSPHLFPISLTTSG